MDYVDDDDAHIHIQVGAQDSLITVQRRLDTLFDGIDFATMDAETIGQEILWSLIADTRIIISSGESFVTYE